MLEIPRYIQSLKIKNFDDEYVKMKQENYFRNALNKSSSSKKPVLIFGCSFGFGWLLDEKQAFAYKLSELSKRDVYNQSISSLGIQYFPYIIEKFNINNEIKNPEYIIFVMIDNHVYRLYRYFYQDTDPYKDIRYKLSVNGNLQLISDRNFFLQKSFIFRYIQNMFGKVKFDSKSFDENFDFMKKHFLYAKKLCQEKFPDTKLVILKYEENYESELFNSDRWSELEQEGFIILDTYSLTGKHLYENEYRIKNDVHPNEKAWDLLTPKIIEKLNL